MIWTKLAKDMEDVVPVERLCKSEDALVLNGWVRQSSDV